MKKNKIEYQLNSVFDLTVCDMRKNIFQQEYVPSNFQVKFSSKAYFH